MADAAEEEEDDQNDEYYVNKYHRGKHVETYTVYTNSSFPLPLFYSV